MTKMPEFEFESDLTRLQVLLDAHQISAEAEGNSVKRCIRQYPDMDDRWLFEHVRRAANRAGRVLALQLAIDALRIR